MNPWRLESQNQTKIKSKREKAQYLGEKDFVDIQLNEKNFARGSLQDGKGMLLLFDSGATRSIVSESFVTSSNHLSSLKATCVEPVRFRLGNGQHIIAEKSLEFIITIQGHSFCISALVAKNLIGADVILGTKTLKELKGILDFSSNCFRIKSTKSYLRPVHKVTLHPGQSKYVNVKVKVPAFASNSEVVVCPTRMVSHMCPTAMLVRLRRGRTRILLKNRTDRMLEITPSRAVAYTELDDIVSVIQEIPEYEIQCAPERYGQRQNFEKTQQSTKSYGQESLYAYNSNVQIDREQIRRVNLECFPHLDATDPIAAMTDEEIIRKHINLKESNLHSSEQEDVVDMIYEYREAFSLYSEISSCPNFEAEISLTNDEPFYIRPYRLSGDDREIVTRELEKLGKIRNFGSWTSVLHFPSVLDSQERNK